MYQFRASRPDRAFFRHHTQTFRHFSIGFHQVAKVAAEDILVELLARLDVPQTTRIRADLISKDHAGNVVFENGPEFDLEIYQLDANAKEQ